MDIAYNTFILVLIILIVNSVNIVDGLDGLITGISIIIMIYFIIIGYFVSHPIFSSYLGFEYNQCIKEISIFCLIVVGIKTGFLWFNSPPAKIFMGDTGSLTIGTICSFISIFVKHEILFLVIGFIFFIEGCSVIIQILYYKITHKKILKIAPIHHHFEYLNIPEIKIVLRLWIVTLFFFVIGLYSIIV